MGILYYEKCSGKKRQHEFTLNIFLLKDLVEGVLCCAQM